jgi:hypothetical protein
MTSFIEMDNLSPRVLTDPNEPRSDSEDAKDSTMALWTWSTAGLSVVHPRHALTLPWLI